jgi:anaerobic ribonucleoside-triphosphate reductase activating protein
MKINNSPSHIFVNLIYHPVLSLGPGERTGLWTQGCSIRCPGCAAQYAWDFGDEYKMKIKDAAAAVLKYAENSGCTALTISGGEPFDQPRALDKLLTEARRGGIDDIMLYSGYQYGILKEKFGGILDNIDALVDSPFIEGMPSKSRWSGSANQNLIILTKDNILKEKYSSFVADTAAKRQLQVISHNDKVYIIGIGDQADTAFIKSEFGSI